MYGLAQIHLWMFGRSKLAEVLKQKKDPHLMIVAELLGITYDEAKRRKDAGDPVVVELRRCGKVANYGFAGGMGAKMFVNHARARGVDLTFSKSLTLRRGYFKAWREMTPYFAFVSERCGEVRGPMTQFVSNRVRGDCGYCDGANTLFQGLVADFAKAACFEVSRESYAMPSSPLYGCKPRVFGHDAILLSAPEARCHEAAMRLKEIMEATARRYHPGRRSQRCGDGRRMRPQCTKTAG